MLYAIFLSLFLHSIGCRGSIYRALGLMVAASPCALAVAPLAYATAISACAKKVVFKKSQLIKLSFSVLPILYYHFLLQIF